MKSINMSNMQTGFIFIKKLVYTELHTKVKLNRSLQLFLLHVLN